LEAILLPFLKKNKDSGGISGILIKNRTPDESTDQEQESNDEYSLADCAKDLISAVHSNDHEQVAEVLKEFIDMAQNQSKDQDESESPHTYESQNIKAGQE
jgi:hypothetical protein